MGVGGWVAATQDAGALEALVDRVVSGDDVVVGRGAGLERKLSQ
jgi:hypothetical protein